MALSGSLRAAAASAFVLVTLPGAAALAREPSFDAAPASEPEAQSAAVSRPFLYIDDPSALPRGVVHGFVGMGFAQIDRGAARPFAADVARAGAVMNAGAEVGLTNYLSIAAQGLLAGEGAGSDLHGGAMAGLTLSPLDRRSTVDVSITGGYLRELGGSNGAFARVSVAGDLGPARLALGVLGEHVFEAGRDGVDVLITTGASYAIVPWARVGAEYVVQDLEGAWDEEEADGGLRHFAGPTVAVDLLASRAGLVMGPAFGLSEGAPSVLGRVTAHYLF